MKLKKILFYLGGLIIICMIALIIYMYPFYHFFFTPVSTAIDKDLTVMSGGGNSGILVTDSAVVVIDTKMGSMAKKLYQLAKEKAGNKKILVINTHFHGDHIYGNKFFKGCTIYIGGYDTSFARKNIEAEDMPTNFIADSLVLPLGNEVLVLCNMGQAHTYDDMVVYLRHRELLFTGDLVFNRVNPAIIKDGGSDIDKWMKVLDRIPRRWDLKTVIPGHGSPGGPEMISNLKRYFSDMQIAASHPEKRTELTSRYKSWRKMPLMSSPGKTIEYFQGK
jgi:glyoxylase-like metal-dependent hydrolase (beta-lactamase superfamily II)